MNIPKSSLNLNRILFIIPNAFTIASIFCGTYAILKTLDLNEKNSLNHAGIAIFLAALFDLFDGRIARSTKTQSNFGIEFDSLADIINFGIAPSIIIYQWALWPFGNLGILAIFIFISCGAIRLAKHNVSTNKEDTPTKYFIGLPIPLASAMLISIIIFHYKFFNELPLQKHNLILILVLIIGFLMVSNIPYWSFKNLKFKLKPIIILFLISIVFLLLSMIITTSLILVILISLYIISGIILYIFNLFHTDNNKLS